MEELGLFEATQTQLSARGHTDEPVTDERKPAPWTETVHRDRW